MQRELSLSPEYLEEYNLEGVCRQAVMYGDMRLLRTTLSSLAFDREEFDFIQLLFAKEVFFSVNVNYGGTLKIFNEEE